MFIISRSKMRSLRRRHHLRCWPKLWPMPNPDRRTPPSQSSCQCRGRRCQHEEKTRRTLFQTSSAVLAMPPLARHQSGRQSRRGTPAPLTGNSYSDFAPFFFFSCMRELSLPYFNVRLGYTFFEAVFSSLVWTECLDTFM
jgi:hypothetical protein